MPTPADSLLVEVAAPERLIEATELTMLRELAEAALLVELRAPIYLVEYDTPVRLFEVAGTPPAPIPATPFTLSEVDGVPSITDARALLLPNGTLVDHGGGIGEYVPAPKIVTLAWGIDTSPAVLTAGLRADIPVGFAGTITGVTLTADQVGSILFDVQKAPLAAYPPTGSNAICGDTPPTLVGADHYHDTTLLDWTLPVAAGDVLAFEIVTVATIQRITIALDIRRS